MFDKDIKSEGLNWVIVPADGNKALALESAKAYKEGFSLSLVRGSYFRYVRGAQLCCLQCECHQKV